MGDPAGPALPLQPRQQPRGPQTGKLELVGKFVAEKRAGDPIGMGQHGPLGSQVRQSGDQGQGVDQRVCDDDRLIVGRRFAESGDTGELGGFRLVTVEQQRIRRTDQPRRTAPDLHEAGTRLIVQVRPESRRIPQHHRGKIGRRERHVRDTQRHAVDGLVPFVRSAKQPSDLRVHQPDADGQFPPFSLTIKGTREHDFDKMSDVLPDSPRTFSGRHPSRHVERLAHQSGDVFQGDDEERSDKQVRVSMKGSAPGVDRSLIEPRGRNLNSTEEISQRLRRVRERLRVLLHARVDELMNACLIE